MRFRFDDGDSYAITSRIAADGFLYATSCCVQGWPEVAPVNQRKAERDGRPRRRKPTMTGLVGYGTPRHDGVIF